MGMCGRVARPHMTASTGFWFGEIDTVENAVSARTRLDVTDYDPEKGLKTIAVAEATEKTAIRAVRANPADPFARQKLAEITEKKLIEQRQYVLWRDEQMKPRRDQGAAGRGKKSSRVPAVALPPLIPGRTSPTAGARRW